MRIAYLDCFSGISGDMFLGALVDAGVSPELLEKTVAALGVGARLEISRVVRNGIAATKIDVWSHGEKDMPREEFWEQQGGHSRSHPHEGPELAHADGHGHDHGHDEGQHPHHHGDASRAGAPTPHEHSHGRGLTEIRRIISQAAISGTATATAIRIFETLGQAEARIHNTSVDQVHFHEVGAVDAMVDIVCAAVGAEALAVGEWVCSPLNVGGGTVKCAHGTLPVPAPATVAILKDAPVYSSGPRMELVTPTGAAIVKTLASRFGDFPAMIVEKVGYGAGAREFERHPNVLRLTIGESAAVTGTSREMIAVLEANLDDLNPQVLGYATEQLLADGALDVFNVPVQMKKGRPGMLLTVLCKLEDAERLTKIIFAETTTLGVRRRDEQRQVLARRWESVETAWGPVRIKIASMNGTVSNYAPEYEDCRALAEANHVPLKQVMEEAVRLFAAK